jgi:hypothetical protein
VTAPVIGSLNEKLSARIDGIGLLAGSIARRIPDGFVFEIDASEAERDALASKIKWLKRRHMNAEPDRREHKRVLPRDPRSYLKLADGKLLKCMLIDISRSGAAVSADVVPAIGDSMVVGTLPAKVVRPLPVGFAVQFDDLQALEDLEKKLARPKAAPAA